MTVKKRRGNFCIELCVIMSQNGEEKLIEKNNNKSTKENNKSGKSCKCYCQGGKRISYPYGWTTNTSTTATASFQYDSIDELCVDDRSETAKSTHDEHMSYQTKHPVAMKRLESQPVERKPSLSLFLSLIIVIIIYSFI
ncbi:unnamed protein product [Onchocerca flexuosa]|uniref:Transmembrane protein n=1 Tax=Onchocerca flexuosa TaxID=387005 RepID=A0A183H636_9BILA|nr:unnamed protein product [Onchocerca flexuosa]